MAEVVAQLEKQLESERKELAYARLKIQVLEERLRLCGFRIWTEQRETKQLQLELLEQEPGVSQEEVVAEASAKHRACYGTKETQASRTSDSARESSPCGTGDCLHTGAACMP